MSEFEIIRQALDRLEDIAVNASPPVCVAAIQRIQSIKLHLSIVEVHFESDAANVPS